MISDLRILPRNKIKQKQKGDGACVLKECVRIMRTSNRIPIMLVNSIILSEMELAYSNDAYFQSSSDNACQFDDSL